MDKSNVKNNIIVELDDAAAGDKKSKVAETTENKQDKQAADNDTDEQSPNARSFLLPTDDNENENHTSSNYSKEYEAVLQLKQQLESKRSKNSTRRKLPSPSIDWLLTRKPREYKLLAFVTFLLCVIVIGLIVVYHFHEEDLYYVYHGPGIMVNEKTLDIEFYAGGKHHHGHDSGDDKPVLRGRLWRTRPHGRLPYDCTKSLKETSTNSSEDKGLCLLWKRLQHLRIELNQLNNDTQCYDVRWTPVDSSTTQMDCYYLDSPDVHWYGAGLFSFQNWPLDKTSVNKQPYVTGTLHERNSFGPVLQRYWLTSRGVAILVPDTSPLQVSFNAHPVDDFGRPTGNSTDKQLCLYVDTAVNRRVQTALNYTVCVGKDVRQIHEAVVPQFGHRNAYTHVPLSLFVDQPTWSTWSHFKDDYNQTSLAEFAQNIAVTSGRGESGIRKFGGLLLVDDGWEEHYGDLKFNASKFEDPARMVEDLHNFGFKVSLWLHPQFNTDSASFQQATFSSYLVRDITGEVPGLTRWWNGPRVNSWSRGVAGIVDVSDAQATLWYRQRLTGFRSNHGFDGFHFAGGETFSWPLHSTVFTQTFIDPNDFTYYMAELMSTLSVERDYVTIVQSAYKCQPLPVLVRVTQGSSSWSDIGGLKSVIPSALSLGLIGYPFFIPEAVGGSAFNGLPSKELYIRWLQVATFFPILHLSIGPDTYDAETVAIANKMLAIHRDFVVPRVHRTLNESADALAPIIRPLWWLAPTDHHALIIDSQFLLGDSVLVAPVVEEGARHRDIYFPPGEWHDQLSLRVYKGPLQIKHYPVPLDQVPYFVRI